MGSERLRTWIAAGVFCVWMVAALDGILTQNWTGLGIVTPVMMLIGGFLFGVKHEEYKQRNGQSYLQTDPPPSDDLSDW